MRFGVAIPCYKYHLPQLKRCLDSIEAQTLKPDQVVVSCSSTEEAELPQYNYSFPLTILTKSERQNAAQNRNRAATALQDIDLISFFDADDVMHPQRLEFIKSAFCQLPTSQIVFHSYIDEHNLQEEFQYYQYPRFQNEVCIRTPSGCVIVEHCWQTPIHHSQATVAAEVIKSHQFPEAQELERREDALFCGNVVAAYPGRNVYLDNKLSKYYMEGSTYIEKETGYFKK